MTKLKIGINGFGRIGRNVFRKLITMPEVQVVHINDLTDNNTLAHLLKYDSVHGKLNRDISASETHLLIDGKAIEVTAERDPAKLPWGEKKVDIVLECTGIFRSRETAGLHLTAGAKKVLLSAPAKGDVDATIVLGVNDHILTPDMRIISNASCTTNCLAPMVKVLHENFGIEKGYVLTVHAYTADQNLQDGPHRDLRRARAAALNIVPTTTGAAKAVGMVLPEMQGRLDGYATRVPVADGSLTDLTAVLSREVSAEEINAAFEVASKSTLKGIVEYSLEPLVSSDIIGNTHSCIFDALTTKSMGNLVKVIAWYDNEGGYSSRLAELATRVPF